MNLCLVGPITDQPDRNKPAFDEAATRLRGLGHHVASPVDLWEQFGPDRSWSFYLTHTLDQVRRCEAVVLLHGWQDSVGSLLEILIALVHGKKILGRSRLEPIPVSLAWVLGRLEQLVGRNRKGAA